MAYIGNSPANVGNYQVVDDISSTFNGVLTSFALTASSLVINPAKSGQLLVSINGVLQEPDDTGTEGFLVSNSNIVFSSAPATGSTFWAVFQGQNVDVGTPSNATVGLTQLSATGTASSATFLAGDNTWKTVVTDSDLVNDTTPELGGNLDGSGYSITADDFIGPLNGAIQFTAINRSGGTINKGQAIYISGISGNTPEIGLADANNASTMPAFGLAGSTATNNNNLEVVTFGSIHGVQTNYTGWALGDTLYISTTAGTLTNVAPSGEAAKIQNIGTVERLHSSNGTIKVGGAGRTNATPNLDEGKIFLGNASNQAVTATLSTAALPSQTGNAGKYLGTDGTDATWNTLDTDANSTTKGLYEHANTIAANYTIATGNNALTAGPITINTGVSVTVPTGSTWVVA
jgi:hypothetical protein